MVSLTTRSKLGWLCQRNSSIGLSQFIQKTIKLKRPWRCTRRCINGRRPLKSQRNLIMVKYKNLKAIITPGCWNLDSKKKQLKSSKNKVIIPQPSNFILKAVFQPELPMQFTTLMSAILKMSSKKLPVVLLLQVCLKKQENSMNKWKNFKEPLTATLRVTSTKRLLTLPKMLNRDLQPVQKKDGVIILSQSNKPKLPSIITSKQKKFKKPLRHQLLLETGTKPSNYLLIKLLKLPDLITGRLLNIMPQSDNMTLPKNITLRQHYQLMPSKCMLKLANGSKH